MTIVWIALIFLAVVAWYAIGVGGFVFWWTSQHDLGDDDLRFGLMIGVLGPLTWAMGALIHNDRKPRRRVVMRRRS